ncbi:fumarylacetoacetate hydrolase family protein [Salisediminibacterium beveridgei]|uniref:Fumarylacetoacetate hydrolase family protein n=1 Tax=Salisediminibacterium beveridgei TaxID=632773 RepID=A0A1D7QXN2_9BACI|nr:fumarylacetoacetate hydrolase family protein [Salisediminibacterium beveridgei]AOM83771.1 Fumarylacetoacetate hydrolase family protein [Salisediminibacterium beveridgei]
MNIYCVGKNYAKHAKEMDSAVPSEPMIFGKATHSLIKADGSPIHLPDGRGSVHYEVELVFELDRDYEQGMKPEDCIANMAIGIDFTLRDEQNAAREQGGPWFASKSFPGSALITEPFPFPGVDALNQSKFALLINGEKVQEGHPLDMVFHLDQLLPYISNHFGLGKGDLIFSGTPEGVGPIKTEDKLELLYEGRMMGSALIQLDK